MEERQLREIIEAIGDLKERLSSNLFDINSTLGTILSSIEEIEREMPSDD